jgi:hypothetical protein
MFDPKNGRAGSNDMNEEFSNKGDYLLEVLELAMNRDPDQDFELLLVLESESKCQDRSLRDR